MKLDYFIDIGISQLLHKNSQCLNFHIIALAMVSMVSSEGNPHTSLEQ